MARNKTPGFRSLHWTKQVTATSGASAYKHNAELVSIDDLIDGILSTNLLGEEIKILKARLLVRAHHTQSFHSRIGVLLTDNALSPAAPPDNNQYGVQGTDVDVMTTGAYEYKLLSAMASKTQYASYCEAIRAMDITSVIQRYAKLAYSIVGDNVQECSIIATGMCFAVNQAVVYDCDVQIDYIVTSRPLRTLA